MTPAALSPRELTALRFIARCVATRGFPPTHQELLTELGARSTNWAAQLFRGLERKGYLVRQRGQARALSLTRDGREYVRRLQ
jgi:SOS-response transcriptional repressor LexA